MRGTTFTFQYEVLSILAISRWQLQYYLLVSAKIKSLFIMFVEHVLATASDLCLTKGRRLDILICLCFSSWCRAVNQPCILNTITMFNLKRALTSRCNRAAALCFISFQLHHPIQYKRWNSSGIFCCIRNTIWKHQHSVASYGDKKQLFFICVKFECKWDKAS